MFDFSRSQRRYDPELYFQEPDTQSLGSYVLFEFIQSESEHAESKNNDTITSSGNQK